MKKTNLHERIALRDIVYLMTILRQGTLRRSAPHLYVSESALSQAVRTIEQKWEMPLFRKSGRRLVPTEAMERLRPYLETMEGHIEKLDAIIDQIAHPDHAIVRLGIVSLARHHVWRAVERFVDAHGDRVNCEVVEASTPQVIEGLHTTHLDAGVILHSPHNSDLSDHDISYTPLMTGHLVVVAHSSLPIASARQMSYDLLTQLPIIGYPRGYMIQDLLIKILGPRYEEAIRFTSTLGEWQQLALELRKGVMVLPDFCVPAIVSGHTDCRAISLIPPVPIEMTFAVTPSRVESPIISDLLHYLRGVNAQENQAVLGPEATNTALPRTDRVDFEPADE